MTHGHEVMEMMVGKSFTRESLIQAILEKYGPDERFFTCCADNLTAEGLVDFLESRGKFMPMGDGFTADESKRCDHEK